MRATFPALLTLLSASLSVGSLAQDAPAPGEPSVQLGGPKVEDDDAPKVDLGSTDTPPAPGTGGASDGPLSPSTPDKPAAVPESIKKMSDEEKRKLGGLLQDASSYLSGVRVQEAFEKLVDAEAMAPDYAAVHNLIGAAHTKVRNFDKAALAFEKAVALDPRAFMSKFNLTEIRFVQHKWEQAQAEFEALVKENPDMPESTLALIEFKILICMLKQGNGAGASEVLKKYDFLDDHPAFYFCNAAIHFSRDEEEKARGWMQSAERIFPAGQNGIYADSFIEVGWIDNLQ